jgi:hypothetical protein
VLIALRCHSSDSAWEPGRGEILVPPTEPGDKPIILRPDDRPKKQAECPECGYTIRLSKRWADVGLPSCPTDGAALALEGTGEANEGEDVHVLVPAAVRLTWPMAWTERRGHVAPSLTLSALL